MRLVRPVFAVALLTVVAGCGGGSGSSVTPPPPPGEVITITTNSNVQCVMTVPFSLPQAALNSFLL